MALQCPDWLETRGGGLKAGSTGGLWFVMLGGEPQYSLAAVPMEGKFGCTIRQTNNGKRIGGVVVYPSAEDALRGGLQELAKSLGWL